MVALSSLIYSLFDDNPEPELTRSASLVDPASGSATVTAFFKGEAFEIEIRKVENGS